MSYQEVQRLAKKFAQVLTPAKERTKEFNMQRVKLEYFHNHFYRKMRALLGSMEGDIRVLHEQGFDPIMLKLFIKSYRDLLEILKSVNEKKPYMAAEKFVKYVLERPTSSILENLDFLIQHHLGGKKIETKEGPILGRTQISTIKDLRELAISIKKFIENNPLIPIPGDSGFPIEMVEAPAITQPVPVGSIEKTNPAIPAKKKLAL
jgi:hypothetical protein